MRTTGGTSLRISLKPYDCDDGQVGGSKGEAGMERKGPNPKTKILWKNLLEAYVKVC